MGELSASIAHELNNPLATVALRTEELRAAKNAAERAAEVNARLARESALILNSATDGILGIDLDTLEPQIVGPANSDTFEDDRA